MATTIHKLTADQTATLDYIVSRWQARRVAARATMTDAERAKLADVTRSEVIDRLLEQELSEIAHEAQI